MWFQGAGKGSFRVLQVVFRIYKHLQKELEDLKLNGTKRRRQILITGSFSLSSLMRPGCRKMNRKNWKLSWRQLTHAEEIKSTFAGVQQLLDDERFSVVQNLKESSKLLESIQIMLGAQEMARRLQSCLLEVKDILEEADVLAEKTEYNPARIELVNDRLNLIYSLQQKHQATVRELISLKDSFGDRKSTR
jgi:DNA repair protein RecN (Recombination protein N)